MRCLEWIKRDNERAHAVTKDGMKPFSSGIDELDSLLNLVNSITPRRVFPYDPPQGKHARNFAILLERASGDSLKDIGERHGICSQRAREVCERYRTKLKELHTGRRRGRLIPTLLRAANDLGMSENIIAELKRLYEASKS